MELKDTIEGMLSSDYRERFKAEYMQARIRRMKLANMIDKYIHDELSFQPMCSPTLLMAQCAAMDSYILLLDERARLECIDLTDVINKIQCFT